MKLLSVLAMGVRGAEDGTAQVYNRGTSTRATVYATFEGTGADASGSDVALDANGGAEVYVNAACDVVAKTAGGVTVREWTEGDGDASTEVRSVSFTGTDYATALTAASYPLTLRSALDKLYLSAGATDFNVMVGGVATTLQSAFAAFSGLFINVKALAYGALGNGTTDDTSAIQAALTAANSATGAIVFFPAGTYRITAELTVGNLVSIMGAGPGQSLIEIDHASANAMHWNGAAATTQQTVTGLTIRPRAANTGASVLVDDALQVRFDHCRLGSPLYTNGDVVLLADSLDLSSVRLEDVNLYLAGAAAFAIRSTTLGAVAVVGGGVVLPATYNGVVYRVSAGFFDGTNVSAEATTAGTFVVWQKGAGYALLYGSVTACVVSATGGATMNIFDANVEGNALTQWVEEANVLPPFAATVVTYAPFTVLPDDAARVTCGSRRDRITSVTDTVATVDNMATTFGDVKFIRTTGSDFTMNPALSSHGAKLVLTIHNTSGGNRIVTWGALVKSPAATHTVTSALASVFAFVLRNVNGSRRWLMTSVTENLTV